MRSETLLPKAKFLRRLSAVFRAMGNIQMGGLNRLIHDSMGWQKQTPAHAAAQRGDIAVVRVLAEHARFDTETLEPDRT